MAQEFSMSLTMATVNNHIKYTSNLMASNAEQKHAKSYLLSLLQTFKDGGDNTALADKLSKLEEIQVAVSRTGYKTLDTNIGSSYTTRYDLHGKILAMVFRALDDNAKSTEQFLEPMNVNWYEIDTIPDLLNKIEQSGIPLTKPTELLHEMVQHNMSDAVDWMLSNYLYHFKKETLVQCIKNVEAAAHKGTGNFHQSDIWKYDQIMALLIQALIIKFGKESFDDDKMVNKAITWGWPDVLHVLLASKLVTQNTSTLYTDVLSKWYPETIHCKIIQHLVEHGIAFDATEPELRRTIHHWMLFRPQSLATIVNASTKVDNALSDLIYAQYNKLTDKNRTEQLSEANRALWDHVKTALETRGFYDTAAPSTAVSGDAMLTMSKAPVAKAEQKSALQNHSSSKQ
jgi:hypothetical protein